MNSFQYRVTEWLRKCFGPSVFREKKERVHRFLEEALELAQATGCTKEEALTLVDYVFSRSVGDPKQEVGGVATTLAALCSTHNINLNMAAETELARIWTKIDVIRTKHEMKPKDSPLPGNLSTH